MNKKKSKRRCNYERTTNTLDICHENQLNEFKNTYDNLESLEKQLSSIKKKLNNKNNKTPDVLFDLKQKEKSLKKDISNIKNKNEEIDYLVNTSNILYNYYDSIENTKESDTKNVKTILDFFNPIKNDSSPREDINMDSNRSKLLDQYLECTDKNYINSNLICEEDKCIYCNSKNINELLHDGIIFCTECNSVEYILSDNEKPSYKEPPKEISYFSYNRINHFNEWIAQSQGKETTEIPEEIFDKIYMELKKNKVTNMATLDYNKIRNILKKNKINKYYEHIPYILNRITGKSSPQLTPELEDKLREMFRQIQGPFLKHSPKNRKNFLSYSYVLHKFLEILGEDQYIMYFPLLKSREKLHQQEQIWEKICEDLNWQFIKSI